MKYEWIALTDKLFAETRGVTRISSKKIIRHVKHTENFHKLFTNDLVNDDLGFAKKKTTMLTGYYLNEESMAAAKIQLAHRRKSKNYGSIGVTTYNHFAKKERPLQGPCIQSVVVTQLPRGQLELDVFYRTTEIFKKFAADLIWLRDIFFPALGITDAHTITFHFVNVTWHPMYYAVTVPYRENAVAHLKEMKAKDPQTWYGVVRWLKRYIEQPPSLKKFKQSFRVSRHLLRLTPPATINELKKYLAPYSFNKDEDDDVSDSD